MAKSSSLEADSRTVQLTCEKTGKQFDCEQFKWGEEWWPTPKYCPEIMEQQEAEERAAQQAQKDAAQQAKRSSWLADNMPPIYHSTQLEHPALYRPAIDKVLAWVPKDKGLVLMGPTGRGKTRAMWLVVQRLVLERGIYPQVYSAEQLARKLASCMVQSVHEHSKVFARLANCKLLVIDDIGKESTTERWEADLFELYRIRTDHLRPTILTTNCVVLSGWRLW